MLLTERLMQHVSFHVSNALRLVFVKYNASNIALLKKLSYTARVIQSIEYIASHTIWLISYV